MIYSNWRPVYRCSTASNSISSNMHCSHGAGPMCMTSTLDAIDVAENVDSFGSNDEAAAAAAAAVDAAAADGVVAVADDDFDIPSVSSLDSVFYVSTIAYYCDCSMHDCVGCLCFGDYLCRVSSPIAA